ncbi:hypothetical protein KAH81_06075 [bacterium]|nr:hypothetical protein [bacterium]
MDKFSWVNRPSGEFRGRKIFGIIVIVLTGIVVFWASENNWFFSVIAVFLMVFASSRFYFRTYFYADDIGVGEKFMGYSRTRKWKEFRRVDEGNKAVFLSTFETPRRMDNFRGWFIPTPSSEVKEFIIRKVRETHKPK